MKDSKRKFESILLEGAVPQPNYEGMEGIIYARVSSKRQETDGSGLKSQETRCINDLRSIGVPWAQTFRDSFTGGGDFMKRPAMHEMLDYIDACPHKKFVVVFDDLKRFARDVEFHFKLRTALRARDVVPRCLNYNFDESPEGHFSETIMAAQAELERHQNRRQVIQKQKARLDAGYWAFGSKRGYTMTKDRVHGMISIPNGDAGIIKEALEGFAFGQFPRRIDVARFLVGKNFWKSGRAESHLEFINILLTDSFYAGFIEHPSWGVAKRLGHHQGIISQETFEIIQDRLNKNLSGKRLRHDISSDFPLRGLMVCSSCGGHLTASWMQGRHARYAYYICQQNKSCIYYRKSIKRGDVDVRFKKILRESALDASTAKAAIAVFSRVQESEVQSAQQLEASISKKKRVLRDQIEKITTLSTAAKSERLRDIYENQLESLSLQAEEIDNETTGDLHMGINYQTALRKATILLRKPVIAYHNANLLEQHRLFFALFLNKLPFGHEETHQTAQKLYVTRLMRDFVTANSLNVEMGGIEPPCNDDANEPSTSVV